VHSASTVRHRGRPVRRPGSGLGTTTGAQIHWHPTLHGLDSKGECKNGKQEGPWVWHYDSGQLWKKGADKNGERGGPWVQYREDGTKDEDKSGTYRDGKKVPD
jgi:antitoxin component YwqK of YwqJK toxin-antitoxin module